jgi:hypothetical protein
MNIAARSKDYYMQDKQITPLLTTSRVSVGTVLEAPISEAVIDVVKDLTVYYMKCNCGVIVVLSKVYQVQRGLCCPQLS